MFPQKFLPNGREGFLGISTPRAGKELPGRRPEFNFIVDIYVKVALAWWAKFCLQSVIDCIKTKSAQSFETLLDLDTLMFQLLNLSIRNTSIREICCSILSAYSHGTHLMRLEIHFLFKVCRCSPLLVNLPQRRDNNMHDSPCHSPLLE